MARDKHAVLEEHYKDAEDRFYVQSAPQYSSLVTAAGNSTLPIHRWFKMKEAYSANLLASVMEDLGHGESKAPLRLIDPFSGSGTTGVAAGDLVKAGKLESAEVTALEVNPFLHLVSSAKMSAHQTELKDLEAIAGKIARRAMGELDGAAPQPKLSTFSNPDYFPERVMNQLLSLKASIGNRNGYDGDEHCQAFLNLALAVAVEPSSNLRRDGRALRLSPSKVIGNPIDLFLEAVRAMAEDAHDLKSRFKADVLLSDSRVADPMLPGENNMAIFSPPYPNNLDYTEIYKLEGWLLGLYGDSKDFQDQRRKTIRSHNSLRWGSDYSYQNRSMPERIDDVLAPILDAIPDDQYQIGRKEVVMGYADDMLSTIRNMYGALELGGTMALVVGNSMHGRNGSDYVIASDLILAQLAEFVGFKIEKILVARYPKRRLSRSAYLRESIVTARKV